MAVFEGKKSLNDIIINDTGSDDEEVASYIPPQYLFGKDLTTFCGTFLYFLLERICHMPSHNFPFVDLLVTKGNPPITLLLCHALTSTNVRWQR